MTGAIFQWLHRNDDTGIEDSSKNLRVLWVRALLAHRGEIDDDVADKLLPKDTRSEYLRVCVCACVRVCVCVCVRVCWLRTKNAMI